MINKKERDLSRTLFNVVNKNIFDYKLLTTDYKLI